MSETIKTTASDERGLMEDLRKVQSFLIDMTAGEPASLLIPEGVDPNDFANAYDEAAAAIRSAIAKSGSVAPSSPTPSHSIEGER